MPGCIFPVPVELRERLSGENKTAAFLAGFRLAAVPNCDRLADATPAGPCAAYPMHDSWTTTPCVEGAALAGNFWVTVAELLPNERVASMRSYEASPMIASSPEAAWAVLADGGTAFRVREECGGPLLGLTGA